MTASPRAAAGCAGAGEQAKDDALAALKHHWGDAYDIRRDAGGWRARRRDKLGGDLDAEDPDSLIREIAADYRLKPVPRDLPPEAIS